jgi:predicted PurR-regulated permease PerM
MKFDWNRRYTTIAMYSVLVFMFCFLFYKFTNNWETTVNSISDLLGTLSPFIYAMVIAYFIHPLIGFIERTVLQKIDQQNLKRALSILISYILILSMIVLLLSFVIPQIIDSLQEITKLLNIYYPVVEELLSRDTIDIFSTGYTLDLTIVSQYFNENVVSTLSSVTELISNMIPILITSLTRFTSALLSIILGFIIAIYLLMSKESGLLNARKVIFALFSPKKAISIVNLSKESNKIFISFIIGKLIDSLIIGFMCFVTLLIFNYPYALLLSLIVGITNIIPYFGPFIGGGIGFVLLLIINPVQALWYLLIILALQQFDGNILGPKILGDSTGLSPFWVIFAIIIFGKFFGFVGMFLGVPILAVIKNIIKRQIDTLYDQKMSTM